MKKRELLLHIGMVKTGTSSIQDTLHFNRELLLDNKILYPQTLFGTDHHSQFLAILRDILPNLTSNWSHQITKGAEGHTGQDVLAAINSELRDDTEKVILSAEMISFVWFTTAERIELLKDLFKDFHVSVIIYIRPIHGLLESQTSQLLKTSYPYSDEAIKSCIELVLTQQQKVPAILNIWSEVFGKENIKLKPFESAQFIDGDLIKYFLKSVTDKEVDGITKVSSNESLSIDSLYWMGQNLTYPRKNRNQEEKLVSSLLQGSEELKRRNTNKHGLICPDVKLEAYDLMKPVYKELSESYLNSEPLFLGDGPSKDEGWRSAGNFSTKYIDAFIRKELYKRFSTVKETLEKKVKVNKKLRRKLKELSMAPANDCPASKLENEIQVLEEKLLERKIELSLLKDT